MKIGTFLRVWARLLLKKRQILLLVIILGIFLISTALADPNVSVLASSSDDKNPPPGAPCPDPDPF